MEIQTDWRGKDTAASNEPQFDFNLFKQLYQRFDKDSLALLPSLYDNNVIFKDPIHEIHSLPKLIKYFEGFCEPSTYCEFQFLNQIIAADQGFFQWQMHYAHPKLNKGSKLTLNGASLIKFDARITYHEDFYDMGAMIYQHLPVFGWAIKKINQKLAGIK